MIEAFTIQVEKVTKWDKGKKPQPQTPIYKYLGIWGEEPMLTKHKQPVGIYLGNGFVALVSTPSHEVE